MIGHRGAPAEQYRIFPKNRRLSDEAGGFVFAMLAEIFAEDLVRRIVRLAAVLCIAHAGAAAAQDYPSRPITLVVPYAAGGGNDVMARIVAEKMSKSLGQQIVIENKGGAGGSIATRQVAKAAPDGYTLGLGGTGTLAINPTLYPNVGYDPRKDFAPIGLIATSALVVLVHPSVEAKSIGELIALARREPGRLNYASAGSGSGIHLGSELLAHGRHQAHAYPLQGIEPGAHRSARRTRGDLSLLAAARDRAGARGQSARARRDGACAFADLSRSADGRRCRRRRPNTPPTSTAKRRNGRRS
jgi:hypothetical protein